VAPAVERGELRILWQSSVEANIDRLGDDLLAVWAQIRPERVVLDGLHGLQMTADPPERIHDVLAASADFLVSQGTTVMVTVETPDLLGYPALSVPFPNASRLSRNILAVRYTERGGQLRRVLSIIKLRDSDFDPTSGRCSSAIGASSSAIRWTHRPPAAEASRRDAHGRDPHRRRRVRARRDVGRPPVVPRLLGDHGDQRPGSRSTRSSRRRRT